MARQNTLTLAISHFQAGDLAAAERLGRQVLARAPNDAVALQIVGLAAHRSGRSREAVEALRQCVALRPAVADYRNTLGAILLRLGCEADAEQPCREAIKLRPDYPEAHANLALALERLGRFAEAELSSRRAIELRPRYVAAHIALAGALRGQGRLDEAIASLSEFRQVAANAEALAALAAVLLEAGRLGEAIDVYRRAIDLDPRDSDLHSRLLYALHYHPDYGPDRLLQEHLTWAARHAEPLYRTIRPHDNDPSPDRRLRIGYVSADFRRHSVATFLEPLIVGHDTDQTEVFCYSDVRWPDAVTRLLQVAADVWRPIAGLSDEQAAEVVRRDRIDILVDPAGHLGPNRPLLFARKPAPVQIAYPGYPGTSGLKTMDYFVTDEHQDPPGLTEGHYVEKLIRLPGSCRCYQPPENAPRANAPPSLGNGFVTFGSVSRIEKITPATMALWGRVLGATPGSRLLVLTGVPGDAQAERQFRGHFERQGLTWNRVELLGARPAAEYLRLFHRIDVALDSHPYGGCTTLCDGLWMGVPAVALNGDRYASTVSRSILRQVGLGELSTSTEGQYVSAATTLAGDAERRLAMRMEMRSRMMRSRLMDAAAMRDEWTAACRGAWRRFVEAGAPRSAGRP